MKITSCCTAATFVVAFLCLASESFGQRYLSEKKPDLSLISATVKREGTDQLNVIWSIKNTGDGTAADISDLVSLNVESSAKPNRAGEAHTWILRGNQLPLGNGKRELKPGETVSGSSLIACSAQDLVSLRVSLYIEQENYELKKENNSLVTLLVGK